MTFDKYTTAPHKNLAKEVDLLESRRRIYKVTDYFVNVYVTYFFCDVINKRYIIQIEDQSIQSVVWGGAIFCIYSTKGLHAWLAAILLRVF